MTYSLSVPKDKLARFRANPIMKYPSANRYRIFATEITKEDIIERLEVNLWISLRIFY
jgi:hypothetical protein